MDLLENFHSGRCFQKQILTSLSTLTIHDRLYQCINTEVCTILALNIWSITFFNKSIPFHFQEKCLICLENFRAHVRNVEEFCMHHCPDYKVFLRYVLQRETILHMLSKQPHFKINVYCILFSHNMQILFKITLIDTWVNFVLVTLVQSQYKASTLSHSSARTGFPLRTGCFLDPI